MHLGSRSSIMLRHLRACLLALACTTEFSTVPAQSAERPVFELLHLWTSPIEQPALEVLKDAIVGAGLSWREHRVKGNFYGVRRELADRMALDVSPSAVFWIGAFDRKSRYQGDVFRRIDEGLGGDDIRGMLLPEILSEVSSEKGLNALPLAIHLQNVAIANEKLFKRLGIPYPSSWAQFLEIAPSLKSAGVTPLAVSGQRWLFRFLYLSILADGLEPEEFERLLFATMPRDRFIAIAKRSFEMLRALKPFSSSNYDSIVWDDAVRQVIDGTSAMTITGDFAAPAINGEDVKCAGPPGSNFLMWSFDVVAFPVRKDRAAQDIAIPVLFSRDVLTRFGAAKGGVPVVTGVTRSLLDSCSATSLDRWKSQKKVLLSSENWGEVLNIVSSLAQLVWTSDSIDLHQVASQLFDEISGAAK